MKRAVTLIVLLSLILVFDFSAVAQRSRLIKKEVAIKRFVNFLDLKAISSEKGVLLEWETDFESKNLGFFIYRIKDNGKILVSDSLIPGGQLRTRVEQAFGQKYTFFDEEGDLYSTYVIESLNEFGQKSVSKQFSAKPVEFLSDSEKERFELNKKSFQKRNSIVEKNELIAPDVDGYKDQLTLSDSDLTDSFEAQKWIAAQPGSVKLGVKKEGIYRVTKAELANAGFNVNATSDFWQLYCNGVEQSIIVAPNGDYIEFYGKGIDERDSDTQIYFLVPGTQNGKRMQFVPTPRPIKENTVTSFAQSFIFKERTVYTSGVYNGDAENYFGRVVSSTPVSIPLNLSAVDFSSLTSSIDITVQGITQTSHQVKVVLNGVELGVLNGNSTSSMTQHFDIQTSLLNEGNNSLVLTSLNGTQDISFFDTVKVNFARKFIVDQNKLSFYTTPNAGSFISGFSSPDVRVYDVTSPDNPVVVSKLRKIQTPNGYQVYLSWNNSRKIFAMENSAFSQVASITPNTPSEISNLNHNGKLIIIAYKSWLQQANDWANYRRADGFSVEVVDVEDIFDEFSFGVFNSNSIKSFLQFAKNNWQTAPEYVLLIGDGTHDTRNYTGGGSFNFIPTKMVETFYMETGSDEALADFDDDGLAELAIGRIPAQTPQDVTLALNKVTVFEQTVSTALSRGILFASDEPNGYDFQALSSRLQNQLPAGTSIISVSRTDCFNISDSAQKAVCTSNLNATLKNEMNSGKYLVNYSGHGNVADWAVSSFFSKPHADQLVNGSNLSLFSMLTCLNGYFIQNSDSISERLLKNQNGGAVATWASTGLTTPDIQEVMATRFYNRIGVAATGTRIGDLIKDAKTTINAGRDVRLSWSLLGDPTLKVR